MIDLSTVDLPSLRLIDDRWRLGSYSWARNPCVRIFQMGEVMGHKIRFWEQLGWLKVESFEQKICQNTLNLLGILLGTNISHGNGNTSSQLPLDGMCDRSQEGISIYIPCTTVDGRNPAPVDRQRCKISAINSIIIKYQLMMLHFNLGSCCVFAIGAFSFLVIGLVLQIAACFFCPYDIQKAISRIRM